MVEIIKKGTPPEEVDYDATCYRCGTIFKFKAKEAKLTHDYRDGDYLSIPCPVCNHPHNQSVRKVK